MTINDVAASCRVSKATVSKVLNRPPEQLDVSDAVRARVLAACRELGYRPDWLARAFAVGRTRTIGLIVQGTIPGYRSQIWQDITVALASAFYEKNFDVQFVPTAHGPERCREVLQDRRVEGCVVFHELAAPVENAIRETGVPAVVLNASGNGVCPAVVPDDLAGATELTRHLIELGHRHIAYVDTSRAARHFSYHLRLGGYRKALADAGLAGHEVYLTGSAEEVAARLCDLRPRPTAIVAYDDRLAAPLLNRLWQRGLRVPRDVSLATFNNTEATEYSIPPMTTMEVPAVEMAQTAARILVGHIESREAASPVQVMIPERLIRRESTESPASFVA